MIGRIKLPLHRVSPFHYECLPLPPSSHWLNMQLESGVSKDYALKDKSCTSRGRGVLFITCDMVFHPIRAGIIVFTPKDRIPEERAKLQTKVCNVWSCDLSCDSHIYCEYYGQVLMNNIRRVTALVNMLMLVFSYYHKMWSWEDKKFSAISLVVSHPQTQKSNSLISVHLQISCISPFTCTHLVSIPSLYTPHIINTHYTSSHTTHVCVCLSICCLYTCTGVHSGLSLW